MYYLLHQFMLYSCIIILVISVDIENNYFINKRENNYKFTIDSSTKNEQFLSKSDIPKIRTKRVKRNDNNEYIKCSVGNLFSRLNYQIPDMFYTVITYFKITNII